VLSSSARCQCESIPAELEVDERLTFDRKQMAALLGFDWVLADWLQEHYPTFDDGGPGDHPTSIVTR
jgi:hypothetical protein